MTLLRQASGGQGPSRTIRDIDGRRLEVIRYDDTARLVLRVGGYPIILDLQGWDDLAQCIAFPPHASPLPIKKPLRARSIKT